MFVFGVQMDNQIVVSDYAQMDRVLREERAYILNMVKQIKKAGCNVLLIQKSILRYVNTANVVSIPSSQFSVCTSLITFFASSPCVFVPPT